MPVYSYRALTKAGQEVKNKVEDISKLNLIKKLKRNGLMPISVVQVTNTKLRQDIKKRKSKESIDAVLKKVNVSDGIKRKVSLKERIKLLIAGGERIKTRDVMVFTQNFYLLKKANFNNIHALSTIIDGTENLTFKTILEDILLGLEGRRKHVYNNGILSFSISIHLYKYYKGWRTIWISYAIFIASNCLS